MHMIKFEKNPNLVQVYKTKMQEYFNRAEYIKKQVIEPKAAAINNPPAPQQPQGGTGTAAKSKEDDAEDKEKAKL